jgi:hypothetical protein
MMPGWTDEERAAELKRRAEVQTEIDRRRNIPQPDPHADAECIHCGTPYNSALSTGAAAGLCQLCMDRD